MKKLLFLLGLFISIYSLGQSVIQRAGNANTVADGRLMSNYNFYVPRYADTSAANLQKGIDTAGALIYTYSDKKVWKREHSPKKWSEIGGGVSYPLNADSLGHIIYSDYMLKSDSTLYATHTYVTNEINNAVSGLIDSVYVSQDTLFVHKNGEWQTHIIDTFTSNPTITGTSFGKYANGSTPNWTGMSARKAILDAIRNCISPTYATPTASISAASPSFGDKEIGTNLGTVTLTAGSPNGGGNSGGFTGNTFYQNGSPLGGNTTTISSLTTTQTFYVNRTYSQGACLPDNCGEIDCTGRINAGNVNSPNYSYTPRYKKYWGVSLGSTPTNEEILAAVGGGSEFSSGLLKGAFNISIPSDTYYHVFYVYWSSYGNVNTIKDGNGLDVTLTFSSSTISVTNAQGYTFSAKAYVSDNVYKNTTYSINSIN